MELQKIIKDISNERFDPYLKKCNGDIEKAFNPTWKYPSNTIIITY
jgi:hypothetical protein